MAADGSDRAVEEMYKLVTNHERLISEGIYLLGHNNGYRAVASIRLLCEAHPEYISEGIDALGGNKNHTAPRTLGDLLEKFPEPEFITQGLNVLSRNGSRAAIVGIGRIMIDHPEHAQEGFDALRPHIRGDEADKFMYVVSDVLEKQPKAVGPGLAFLQEEGSEASLDLIDHYLEELTGRPLTDEAKIRAGYERFCDGLGERLSPYGIDLAEDGEDYPSP